MGIWATFILLMTVTEDMYNTYYAKYLLKRPLQIRETKEPVFVLVQSIRFARHRELKMMRVKGGS